MLKDIPRTADADVDAANIFDPLSNSSEPLFHAIMPCCIHFGRFSYAVCQSYQVDPLQSLLCLQEYLY